MKRPSKTNANASDETDGTASRGATKSTDARAMNAARLCSGSKNDPPRLQSKIVLWRQVLRSREAPSGVASPDRRPSN